MSGSGADTGYGYQANAIAYIAAHSLAEQGLGWFDDYADVACWHRCGRRGGSVPEACRVRS